MVVWAKLSRDIEDWIRSASCRRCAGTSKIPRCLWAK
jgi:hypothetical protein